MRHRIGTAAAPLMVPLCFLALAHRPGMAGSLAGQTRSLELLPAILAPDGAPAAPPGTETKSPAQAQSPSPPPISPGRALRRARRALAKNQEADALGLYEQVLSQDPIAGSRRAEALYGAGLLHLRSNPESRDLTRARDCFEELLSVYPTHERRREAQTALGLIGQIDGGHDESASLRAEVSHHDEACAEEKTRLIDRARAAEESAGALHAETQTLKSEVRTLRNENQGLHAELEKRDEALRKVKEALVGKRARQ